MPDEPRDRSRSVFAAVLLVVLGLGLCVLYPLAAGRERHSYPAGAVPPRYVELTRGHEYRLSVHGGVDAETAAGVSPDGLRCAATTRSGRAVSLRVTADQAGGKATNRIASFSSPVGGLVAVTCTGLSEVFVDDADDAGFDLAGLYLLLGAISLAVGLPLLLSVLRTRTRSRRAVER